MHETAIKSVPSTGYYSMTFAKYLLSDSTYFYCFNYLICGWKNHHFILSDDVRLTGLSYFILFHIRFLHVFKMFSQNPKQRSNGLDPGFFDPEWLKYFAILVVYLALLYRLQNADPDSSWHVVQSFFTDPIPIFFCLISLISRNFYRVSDPHHFHADPDSRLNFVPLYLLNFVFNADPHPAFHSYADPEPVSQNNANPSGSATLHLVTKSAGLPLIAHVPVKLLNFSAQPLGCENSDSASSGSQKQGPYFLNA